MHEQRPKFDSLFADPRHYRGDCRLMRTAIRRGWLDKAPQADRYALIARFHEAMNVRRETYPDGRDVWALMVECRAAIGLVGDDQTQALRCCDTPGGYGCYVRDTDADGCTITLYSLGSWLGVCWNWICESRTMTVIAESN